MKGFAKVFYELYLNSERGKRFNWPQELIDNEHAFVKTLTKEQQKAFYDLISLYEKNEYNKNIELIEYFLYLFEMTN